MFKNEPFNIHVTDYRLMQVKCIAECSKGSILQYFRPSLSYYLSLRFLFCLYLSGRVRQVLLYCDCFYKRKNPYYSSIINPYPAYFSSPEPKAPGELIGWDSSWRPCVPLSVRLSTLSNMNISETCWRTETKFHLEHYWSGGKAALGFGPDRIRTLVSMATDSSHRVIMVSIL